MSGKPRPWPVETIPTLILGPFGEGVFIHEFGVIEPGGTGPVSVIRFGEGQVVRLSAEEWIDYRARPPKAHVLLLEETAIHEAAHAIVGSILGRHVERVSIFPIVEPLGVSLGRTEWGEESLPGDIVRGIARVAVTALAGRAADVRRGGENPVGDERDLRELEGMLLASYPENAADIADALSCAGKEALEIVTAAWAGVDALASVLVDQIVVNADIVRKSVAAFSDEELKEIEEAVSSVGGGSEWSWLGAGDE